VLNQGCTNSRYLVTWAIKCCAVTHNTLARLLLCFLYIQKCVSGHTNRAERQITIGLEVIAELWDFRMKIASCPVSSAWKLEVASRFLEKFWAAELRCQSEHVISLAIAVTSQIMGWQVRIRFRLWMLRSSDIFQYRSYVVSKKSEIVLK
jgi:hypothetical protein